MSKLLGGVRISYSFDLLLELRNEDEQFKVYSPGGKVLVIFLTNYICFISRRLGVYISINNMVPYHP